MRPFVCILACALPILAQESVDGDLNTRLREAGLQKSQALDLARELCDVHGPRLINTPAYHSAAAWAVARMKALRLLKETGLRPRRTILVVLFDGEEVGLLGAKAYTAAHFGSPGALKPEAEGLLAPPTAARIVHELLAPWRDLGVVGAVGLPEPPSVAGNATILASLAYHLAERLERLPRWKEGDLPPAGPQP